MRVEGRREPEPRQVRAQKSEEQIAEQIRQKIEVLVGKLEQQALDQVAKKQCIEERWYEDLRQYHGRYDSETERELKQAKKSRVFVNLTRTKTHAWEARLSDMLFPTDDKNWGIKPTPVPELSDQAREAVKAAKAMAQQATQAMAEGAPKEQADQIAAQGNEYAERAKQLQAEIDEAKRRSKGMESTIEDQLIESKYNIRSRDVIHDAVKLGTGIMKGPLVSNRVRRQWRKVTEPILDRDGRPTGQTRTLHVLETVNDPRPEYYRVDPWNYFPDMSARCQDDKEFEFERHLMNKKELRALAKHPGFDKQAIRDLLEEGPRDSLPPYIAKLREVAGINESLESRYHVWEYHGAIDKEDIEAILQGLGDDEMLDEIEVDPLDEHRVIVWFCQNKLLKFSIHPLDSEESLYSVFNFEKDDTSLFGYGVPYMMRDSQAAVNGAWRMSMDNAGLSVGPQIVVDQNQIEPVDGNWEITPRKVWQRKKTAVPGGPAAFQVENIPSNQQELMALLAIARQLVDEEINMPIFAQGEPGTRASQPGGAQTMGGMTILMNSANVVFRRVVKNWDDDMTTPNIRRMYDWNMQFNDNEDIKGDMEVDARGSSVLLVRELQAQNLMNLLAMAQGSPILGPMTKFANAYRKLVQCMMLPSDDIVLTDEEIDEQQQQQANQPPEIPPDIQAKLQIAEIERATKLEVAWMQRETQMMQLAETRNMSLEKIAADLEKVREQTRSKERVLAAEIGAEQMMARQAAATGGEPQGSGGYVSAPKPKRSGKQ